MSAIIQIPPTKIMDRVTPYPRGPQPKDDLPKCLDLARSLLRRGLDVDVSILDTFSGELLHASPEQPSRDYSHCQELAHAVVHRGRPEIIVDEDPFLVLAVPIPNRRHRSICALGTFITSPARSFDSFAKSARRLNLAAEEALRWSADQTPWQASMLLRVAGLVWDRLNSEVRADKAEFEVRELSNNLVSSYEEISLLYSLSQHLKVSRNDSEFCRMVLERLSEVIPAQGLAVKLLPVAEETACHEARTRAVLMTHGDWPIPEEEFDSFYAALGREAQNEPIVLNQSVTGRGEWPYPQVREVVSTPLTEGDRILGWIVAVNHVQEDEFGTVEASLIASVAAILGIHCGNSDLYRRQADFLADVVRALTAAIDAKDPYTCGHSDRVARIAVRLAEELGCAPETLNTIYLSGLLHDIGKIGISDEVLRKPGKLTDAEFEHIKLHPELGYKILGDLKQLGQVLPVVLHHHEAWNGTGYPHALAGTTIPFLARIVAVADSFDAMSSDRPYRKGMAIDKIEQVLRDGSGAQWDARVVDAYFSAREDIVKLVNQERAAIRFDALQWT